MKRLHILAGFILVLTACSAFGVLQPKTFSERLAAGYTLNIQVRDTATVLVSNSVISADDAQNVQNTADQARIGLDLARTFGSTPRGEDKLATTLVILTGLQSYLAERSPK